MTLNSTSNQLLRYAYGELPLLERFEAEHALDQNDSLRNELHQLRRSIKALPQVKFNPAPTTLEAILRYSRKLPDTL